MKAAGGARPRSSICFAVFLCFLVLARGHGRLKKYPLLMPHVRPSEAETYLCTTIRIDPAENYYITAFSPNATSEVAHHMLIFGCSEPGSVAGYWHCGEMSTGSRGLESSPPCSKGSQIIYAWAKNAPTLVLPEGVGFKVGGKTDIQYLVLQVHYATVDSFQDGSTDDSGVEVYYTTTRQQKLAGVLMLGTGGRILPQSIEYMETACRIQEDVQLHPFAFRTHTHELGRVVSGYKVTRVGMQDNWTLIGKKDPQLPQMFYPVENDMIIRKNDRVAARCTMESDRDSITRVGPTNKHEMCNFYIMYWIEHSDPLKQKYCFTPGPPHYYWDAEFNNIPRDASDLPRTTAFF